MEKVPQEESFMADISSHAAEEANEKIHTQQQKVKSDQLNSQDIMETYTSQVDGFSILSVGDHIMVPTKTSSFRVSAKSKTPLRSSSSSSSSPSPTTFFAPRRPKSYHPGLLTKSRSADSLIFTDLNDSPPSPPSSPNFQSNIVFESPIFPPKRSLSARRSLTLRSHRSSTIIRAHNGTLNPQQQPQMEHRHTRRISVGDAYVPMHDDFQMRQEESMDLTDLFPSVFDSEPHRTFHSLPEIKSPVRMDHSPVESGSRGSDFDLALEIDPFEDDCIEFSSRHPGDGSEIRYKMEATPVVDPANHSSNVVMLDIAEDLMEQIETLKAEHKTEVLELNREIETKSRIIAALTKQVQGLMARNEQLSQPKSKKSKKRSSKSKNKEKKSFSQRTARIDMMGKVISSPDASPSLQQRHVVAEASDIEFTDLSDEAVEEKRVEKPKSAKRSSPSSPTKNRKKANRTPAIDDALSPGTDEVLYLGDMSHREEAGTMRLSGGETTDKSRKRRSSRKLSTSNHPSEPDEHPLSQTKRKKSIEARSLRESIAANNGAVETNVIRNNKKGKKSIKSLSETIGNIWAFEWKDPSKHDAKPSSKKARHSSKNLAQLKENLEAVGKLPKRKAKRKSVPKTGAKAKPKTTTDASVNQGDGDDSAIKPKKAKKSNRKHFGVMDRLLSPADGERRRKRKKTKMLQDLSKDDPSDEAGNPPPDTVPIL